MRSRAGGSACRPRMARVNDAASPGAGTPAPASQDAARYRPPSAGPTGAAIASNNLDGTNDRNTGSRASGTTGRPPPRTPRPRAPAAPPSEAGFATAHSAIRVLLRASPTSRNITSGDAWTHQRPRPLRDSVKPDVGHDEPLGQLMTVPEGPPAAAVVSKRVRPCAVRHKCDAVPARCGRRCSQKGFVVAVIAAAP